VRVAEPRPTCSSSRPSEGRPLNGCATTLRSVRTSPKVRSSGSHPPHIVTGFKICKQTGVKLRHLGLDPLHPLVARHAHPVVAILDIVGPTELVQAHRQGKRPSRSEGYEPEMRSHAECFSERATTLRAGAAFVGHQHAEVNRASAILERRRASVLTCKQGLQSAIASDDAGHARTWSKSLRDAEARLLWAEADLEASEMRAKSKQRR
jgi:hypothetical protein